MEGYYIIALFVGLIMGIVWGVACTIIVQSKGYDENWFWWGFFFGIIAFIVACTKPQYYRSSVYNTTETIDKINGSYKNKDSSSSWKCRKCSRTNLSYVGTCVCGMTKSESAELDIKIINRQKVEAENQDKITTTNTTSPNMSFENEKADAILKYKNLLDMGAITEEEYSNKKAELLRSNRVNDFINEKIVVNDSIIQENRDEVKLNDLEKTIFKIVSRETDGVSSILISKSLPRSISFQNINNALEKLCDVKLIEVKEGKYFLKK